MVHHAWLSVAVLLTAAALTSYATTVKRSLSPEPLASVLTPRFLKLSRRPQRHEQHHVALQSTASHRPPRSSISTLIRWHASQQPVAAKVDLLWMHRDSDAHRESIALVAAVSSLFDDRTAGALTRASAATSAKRCCRRSCKNGLYAAQTERSA